MVKPPKYAQENAKKALECIRQGSKAMMRTGRLRAAQLSSGRDLGPVSLRKISQFKRHIKNAEYSDNPCEDDGYVSWTGWGLGYKNGKPDPRFSDWAAEQYKKVK